MLDIAIRLFRFVAPEAHQRMLDKERALGKRTALEAEENIVAQYKLTGDDIKIVGSRSRRDKLKEQSQTAIANHRRGKEFDPNGDTIRH